MSAAAAAAEPRHYLLAALVEELRMEMFVQGVGWSELATVLGLTNRQMGARLRSGGRPRPLTLGELETACDMLGVLPSELAARAEARVTG